MSASMDATDARGLLRAAFRARLEPVGRRCSMVRAEPAAERLAPLIPERAVPFAEPYTSLDALLAEFSGDSESGDHRCGPRRRRTRWHVGGGSTDPAPTPPLLERSWCGGQRVGSNIFATLAVAAPGRLMLRWRRRGPPGAATDLHSLTFEQLPASFGR
jgi:hypothetical protein